MKKNHQKLDVDFYILKKIFLVYIHLEYYPQSILTLSEII